MSSPHNKVLSKLSIERSLRKAIKSFERSEYSSSSAYFCVAFKLSSNKELSEKWKSTFLYAFDRHINHLERFADNQTVVNAFNEAIEAFPNCEDIHYSQGIYYYKKGFLSKAVTCFLASLALNPNYNLSHLCVENIKASSIARWHFIMINDIKRNTAFKNAIFKAVKSGYNNVLDIGSGSGLLSLYALEAGAHKVFACEVSEMLCHMCKDVFESNQVIDKVVLFNDMSTNLQIPQTIDKPVNLVFTEIFDAALFGEHVLTTIHSALKNLLDPNHGMVIPNKATVYGILLESRELRDCFTLNRNKFGNLVVSEDISICVNYNHVKYTTVNLSKVADKKYLSQRFEIINIDFNDIHQIEKLLKSDYELNLCVKCCESGTFDAIGIWFDLNLIDDINISTEPPSELIGWEQAIYPATVKRVSVDNNTKVDLTFTFNEDYMKLSKLKILDDLSDKNELKVHELNYDVIKYLNSYNFHEPFIEVMDQLFKSGQIKNIIDMTYLPVSSLHSVSHTSLQKVMIVTDDNEIRDNINTFIKDTKTKTDKIKVLSFEDFMETNQSIENSVVLTDLIESSGLMRSNILEKLVYLKLYVLKSPIFIPFKICVKGVLIQSEDVIIRSRLISDDNVHGYKIKEFLNIFETETLQNIDLNKIQKTDLSNNFNLLEINLNERIESNEQINVEPSNKCSVIVEKRGELHAVLYWYELHLTQDIIVSSLKLGPNWHSAAFIVKEPLKLDIGNKLLISCIFTNGFLRLKLSSDPNN